MSYTFIMKLTMKLTQQIMYNQICVCISNVYYNQKNIQIDYQIKYFKNPMGSYKSGNQDKKRSFWVLIFQQSISSLCLDIKLFHLNLISLNFNLAFSYLDQLLIETSVINQTVFFFFAVSNKVCQKYQKKSQENSGNAHT